MMRQALRRAETPIAGVALIALGFLVLLPHVRHGGFYADDWSNAASYHFRGWWQTSVSEWHHSIPGRPFLALLHPLPYALLGLNPTYHLAAAVVLAALTSLSFFALLRALGVEARDALALAALSLLFPWADAAHLWPTGAMNNVAVIAYFLGSLAALKGLALRQTRRRQAIGFHLLAAALYLLSVLTYEVAAAAILLSGLLYRTRVPWRALRARWSVDAAIVLVPLAVSLRATSRVRHVGSLGERARDLPHFVGQGLSLFSSIFVPQRLSSSWASSWDVTSSPAGKLGVLACTVAIIAVAVSRSRRPEQRQLRVWLLRAAGGAGVVASAYVMFLGSGLFPLTFPGIDDRVQTFAAFGFVVAAYSVLVLAALLLSGRHGRAMVAIVSVGTLLIGAGFIQRVRTDFGHYDASASSQRLFLASVQRALPRPSHGTTVFTFGYPAEIAPGVPIFNTSWELRGALDLRWRDYSLFAVPIYRGKRVVCADSAASARVAGIDSVAPYGQVVFVDVPSGRARRPLSREACERALTVFRPGPLFAAGQ